MDYSFLRHVNDQSGYRSNLVFVVWDLFFPGLDTPEVPQEFTTSRHNKIKKELFTELFLKASYEYITDQV
ncbi:hypothetical protein K0M31_000726 [Melipona bicolor]|uniref:Uncharacterized protein n=1 Tax=Melipona bicolor TaxID=60889 RepID=A0AA40KWZ0_9HYME|nr:hypothetical protein K0M31_000726 [Melipona bicolor]